MWLGYVYFDINMGGLFSAQYQNAPWSFAKLGDLVNHVWVPLIVLGTAGTADLIRTLRANLLDELAKPYVTVARAKGLTELKLIAKYPVRIAINPFVSSIGGVLPELISGAAIVSVVLPLRHRPLQHQVPAGAAAAGALLRRRRTVSPAPVGVRLHHLA